MAAERIWRIRWAVVAQRLAMKMGAGDDRDGERSARQRSAVLASMTDRKPIRDKEYSTRGISTPHPRVGPHTQRSRADRAEQCGGPARGMAAGWTDLVRRYSPAIFMLSSNTEPH